MGFSSNTPHSDVVMKFQPDVKLFVHNLEFSLDSTSRFALIDSYSDGFKLHTLENPVWVSMASNNLDFVGSAVKNEWVDYNGEHTIRFVPVPKEKEKKMFDF